MKGGLLNAWRAQLWMMGWGVARGAQFWEDRSVVQGGRGVWIPVLEAGVGVRRCGERWACGTACGLWAWERICAGTGYL